MGGAAIVVTVIDLNHATAFTGDSPGVAGMKCAITQRQGANISHTTSQ